MAQQTAEQKQAEMRNVMGLFSAPLAEATETMDLLATIPTLGVGDELQAGMTIGGNFVELERLVSAKFTKSKEIDAVSRLPVSYRIVIERNNQKLAIWATAELKLLGKQLKAGQPIAITYKGKETINGQPQHTFEFKKGEVPASDLN